MHAISNPYDFLWSNSKTDAECAHLNEMPLDLTSVHVYLLTDGGILNVSTNAAQEL